MAFTYSLVWSGFLLMAYSLKKEEKRGTEIGRCAWHGARGDRERERVQSAECSRKVKGTTQKG